MFLLEFSNKFKRDMKRFKHKQEIKEKNMQPYEKDFYKWTHDQAHFLKKGEFEKLDIRYLIEEIEDLGRSQKSALKNQLIRLLMHLLKANYQKDKLSKSWTRSIGNAQIEIEKILEENPSLKKEINQTMQEAYYYARKKAHVETGINIKTFPQECPWTFEQIMKEKK